MKLPQTNGMRPLIFEAQWRIPEITDLVSTVRKPRLYEQVVITTNEGQYEGQIIKVGPVRRDNTLWITVAGPIEMDGQALENVELKDP